jgi:DNA repair photolyase
VKDIFLQWLDDHEPGKKDRVVSRIRELHGGKLYNATFGERMRGQGIFAEQIRQMFEVATRRAGLNHHHPPLATEHFRRPGGTQMELL